MIQANLCDLEQDIRKYFCNIAAVTLKGARKKNTEYRNWLVIHKFQ